MSETGNHQPGPLSGAVERWAALPGNLRGGLWILAAGVFFSTMAALVKALGQRLPVVEVLFLRQVAMTVMVAPAVAKGFPEALVTQRFGRHLLRVALALTAMMCGFTAIVHLPLADATAISFARSFFVTLFAILILHETVGVRRWAAMIIGFLGVLVMLKPTGTAVDFYGFLAAAGAAAAGLVMILIRQLSRTERPLTILTYQAVLVGVATAAPALWGWVQPTLDEWLLVGALGVASVAGQSCNIRAYRAGEAAAVAALDYTRLIYAAIIGVVVFAEWPSTRTLAGAAIILAASLYTLSRESRRGGPSAGSGAGA
ncbi:MAG: DMT family transporter [Hyphomicrobiales bacterium]